MWVITGDGDGLSIGGNHLIHALRRNVNLTILLFNNQIYGLTKGQYSPTSELGKVTKSTPLGSIDAPFNPVAVALGANATFVARTHDLDRKHMQEVFRAAHDHKGAAFVEIWQNCNVFNDGVFDDVLAKEQRPDMLVPLVHGQPIRFGTNDDKGVVMGSDGQLRIVAVDDVGVDALMVHDAHRDDRASPSPWPTCRPTSTSRRRSASCARWSDPSTPRSQRQLLRLEQKGSGDLSAPASNGTWTVS